MCLLWYYVVYSLDIEGTVCAHPQHTREPPAEAVTILCKLGEDPWNRLWLLSRLPQCALNKVAYVVPSIGLV
jgi:trehalose-6-phosphatase